MDCFWNCCHSSISSRKCIRRIKQKCLPIIICCEYFFSRNRCHFTIISKCDFHTILLQLISSECRWLIAIIIGQTKPQTRQIQLISHTIIRFIRCCNYAKLTGFFRCNCNLLLYFKAMIIKCYSRVSSCQRLCFIIGKITVNPCPGICRIRNIQTHSWRIK